MTNCTQAVLGGGDVDDLALLPALRRIEALDHQTDDDAPDTQPDVEPDTQLDAPSGEEEVAA